jgi:hypothetical protein
MILESLLGKRSIIAGVKMKKNKNNNLKIVF